MTAASTLTLGAELAERLTACALDPAAVERLVRATVAEDLAGGEDVTSVATVPAAQRGVADLAARARGTVAGLDVAAAVFQIVSSGSATIRYGAADGDRVEAGAVLLTVEGRTRDLLTAERSALNLLCQLSGVATVTAAWVDAVAGTGAAIRDTRKTVPGLRSLQKYAVRCGGGVNHRMSLSDAALVKDNHVLAAGGVAEAFAAVRARYATLPVEVECDTVEQVAAVVAAGADLVLLDNMTVEQVREAVELTAGRAQLEASGGLTIDRARRYAQTGVTYLAVGALTSSAPVLDIGVDLRPLEGG